LSPPERRWQHHLGLARRNNTRQFIHRAIRKYGESSFVFTVLVPAESREELDSLEKQYIKSLNTLSPNGYNTAAGGQGASGTFSEERRKKIGEKSRGRLHSEETRMKMSKSHLGHSTSEIQKRRAKEANAYCIRCVETNQEFESIKSARLWLRSQNRGGDIQCHLQGKQKTAGGYHWQRIILEKTASDAC